jgi:hypothetical protein
VKKAISTVLILAMMVMAFVPCIATEKGRPLKVREITKLGRQPMMHEVRSLCELQENAVTYRQRIIKAVLKMGHSRKIAEQILDKIASGEVRKDNIKDFFGRDEAVAYFSNMSFINLDNVGVIPNILLNTGHNEEFWVIETQIGTKHIRWAIFVKCGNLSRIDRYEVEAPPSEEPPPWIPEIEFQQPTAVAPPPTNPQPVPTPVGTNTTTTDNSVRESSYSSSNSISVIYSSITDNSDHRQITIVLAPEQTPMRLRGLPEAKFDRGRTENLGTMSSGIYFNPEKKVLEFSKKITAEGGKVTTSTRTSTSSSSSSSTDSAAAAAAGGPGGGSGSGTASAGGAGTGAAAAAAEAIGTGTGGRVDFEVDFRVEI